MPTPVDFKNWRFDPFEGIFVPEDIVDEIRVVELHEEWNKYGIELNEAPQLFDQATLANNMTIFEDVTGGAEFTQVPRLSSPSTGQYRVDYDADTYHGTGRVEFNAADDGKQVRVTYKGLGTVVKDRYQLLQTTVIPTNTTIEGNLQVTDSITVEDNLTVETDTLLQGEALRETDPSLGDHVDKLKNRIRSAVQDWDFDVTIGGGSAEEPDFVTYTSGSGTDIVKEAFTWSGGFLTVIDYSFSTNSGGLFTPEGTLTITYDGDGFVTNAVWS